MCCEIQVYLRNRLSSFDTPDQAYTGTGGKKREAGIRHRPTVILFSRYNLKGLRFCAPTGAVHLTSLKPSSYSPAFNSPELW